MQEKNYPALYRSADRLSLQAQNAFFGALKLHLVLLVIAATLSVLNITHWLAALLQFVSLVGALACSVYLFAKRPERLWYAGRALAESVKTMAWRFMCRSEPFDASDAESARLFQQKLGQLVSQNKDVAQALTSHIEGEQLTEYMEQQRSASLSERQLAYVECRVREQLGWYAKKARFNKYRANVFFWVLIAVNLGAVILAALKIKFAETPIWPTDALVALAASLLSWMQAKRFSELASSYSLAATEIGLIRDQARMITCEKDFSVFVADAENAFSREHTQWVARKDV
ncbi:DUF4231 domain-containing protein [Diaphorobacter nitroreducens]|uniref:DUF4231 domain-containing protein n=1 Tax=Diaphorobacter nitroreducens TaxID=164759 RepID=UPI002897F1C0|nr:DUF4231 domain-containing protein [Diaphorobacter nitroreducens]